ncbi:MAG: hypothetical protein EXS35_16985 [Pedosphaera sp.]|nr:hypothetical protein [Pedosphaera sp.]
MTDSANTVIFTRPPATVEEIQQGWNELKLRVGQLEVERNALEKENKSLRSLLERVVEHRQKSHGELVLLLTGLVTKLPINDVGVVVSKLVQHNANVSEMCAALAKGTMDHVAAQPMVLKELDQTKRELLALLKPAVDELIQLEVPLEKDTLLALIERPESFFAPRMQRANRCFIKGQLPKERVLREFGEAALVFFNDLTTDAKLNPRPKPDEIVLGFKPDFEAWFAQNPALLPEKRPDLLALFQKIQRSKATTPEARQQRIAFTKLSFILELLHYYENQATESLDVVFAQRLPALVEQLVIANPQEPLDEKLIVQAEGLMSHVINPDHRLMIANNVGKSGEGGKTLKFVLKLRPEKCPDQDQTISDFVKHLIAPQQAPPPAAMLAVLRLIHPEVQRLTVRTIIHTDRLAKADAEVYGRALAKELNLKNVEDEIKVPAGLAAEIERQLAWDAVKELIARRAEPGAIANAIRDRLHAKYDADEVKQSWLTLVEADVMTFIRTFCQLPYLADGRTDTMARAVMESYVTRLTHEKYAAVYTKVVNSLKNMFKANAQSPTLVNFLALIKWVDSGAAGKLSADIGMPAA